MRVKRHWIWKLAIILAVLAFFPLVYSVIRSGLYYQYDVDELYHVQYAYLVANNFKPYISFFTIFTPVFHWLQLFVFQIFGFTFETIHLMRWVMVGLFLIRTGLSMWLIEMVWDRKIALFFVLLFLLDPFTVFSAMQIRPDNLMMTVYTLGLVLFSLAFTKHSRTLFFAAGFMLAASVVILLKIVPAVAMLFLLFGIYCLIKKQKAHFFDFSVGFFGAWILFCGYFLLNGSFHSMIQNVFVDSVSISRSILNPSYIWYFYKPNNMNLFGFWGRPLTWWYVWILPVLSVLGVAVTGLRIKRQGMRTFDDRKLLQMILLFSLVIQLAWSFTTRGAFIQYFLPFGWLLSLFAAVFLAQILQKDKRVIVVYCVLFLLFSYVSIRANLNRSTMGNEKLISDYSKTWQIIPEHEYTYPNFLFRPIAYPLTYGANPWDLPQSILKRFGPVHEWLKKYNVRYVFFDSYSAQFLDPQTKEYITTHYEPSGKDNLYILKEIK